MSFTLNTRKVGDVVIIDMSGRLAIGEAQEDDHRAMGATPGVRRRAEFVA